MPLRLWVSRPWFAVAAFAALVFVPAQGATVHLTAPKIYQRAVTSNIALSPDGLTLKLKSGEVFQDDGPASGFSYKPTKEVLSRGIKIRKQLLIPDPRATKAVLMVGGGGDLKVEVNGNLQKSGTPQKIFYGQWQAYNINPAALRPGANDIVIWGTGMVRIARADDSYLELPHRSARSVDGGKSWSVDCLGPAGNIAGEYYVRLFLEHFVSSGSMLLPVVDVANQEGDPLAPPLTAPGPLRVSVTTAPDSTSGVTLRVRSGKAYVPSPATWSEWMSLDRDGMLKSPRGRFVQVEATMATADPLATPRLSEITLTTEPQLAKDWTKAVKVVDFHNEEIVRTSIPFRYEPFTQLKLKELRTYYRLDEVVGGAKTDLDIITRLAAWSARQFKWEEWHLDEYYPPWDALEILKKLPDGKPLGGFCQQYNLVLLQAAESFGFVGRDISIDSGTLGRPTIVGHEAVEIWSNQFRKWIWVDGMGGYYAEDSETGVPLSLWELRQRQIRLLRGQEVKPTRIVHIAGDLILPSMPLWLKQSLQWRGLNVGMSFGELRLIPRSNFLEQKWPLPLNNGKAGWTWNGFDVWTDTDVPAEAIYPNLVTRHGNFEWTLNQAHFVLEPTLTRGEFLVHMDTETPGFETFLAEIDSGGKSPVAPIFAWKLHPGRNRLKVWPRNNAGRDGIASWIELEIPQT
jgi:transglutaminase-like putative cysteine protease